MSKHPGGLVTRLVVTFVLALALMVQSLVAQPHVAQARTTPSEDEASIQIDEPTVAPGDDGVNVPATVALRPDAGIADDAELRLVVEIIIDGQPLADSTVTVTAANTFAVDTDSDGQLRIPAADLGTWPQLTSPDGIDLQLD